MHSIGNRSFKSKYEHMRARCEVGVGNDELVVVLMGDFAGFAIAGSRQNNDVFGVQPHSAIFGNRITHNRDGAMKEACGALQCEREVVMRWYKLVDKSRNCLHILSILGL